MTNSRVKIRVMRQREFLIVGVFFLLMTCTVFAGPPFVTDDPVPTDYQHWEVDFFSTYNRTDDSTGGALPALEVDYGLLPDLQLHLITPAAYGRETGGHAEYGYGDTEIGAKYRFIHEKNWVPDVAIFPLVELPTGDEQRGLGNGKAQIFIPVWLQKTFGPWTTFGGGGFWHNPGDENRDFWLVGWELQRDFGKHLTVGGELYHATSSASGENGHTAFNLGGFWNLDEHRHVLFSFGRDIDGPTRFACYLGLQLTF